MKKSRNILLITVILIPLFSGVTIASSNEYLRKNKHLYQDDITYANTQEGFNAGMRSDFIMNGDSGTDKHLIEDHMEENRELREQKNLLLEEMVAELAEPVRLGRLDIYRTLNVPVFEQENYYFCGPATVKQVIHSIVGGSDSQQMYARRLGTTVAGTDMTQIPRVLNADTDYNYIYDNFRDMGNWQSKIMHSIYSGYPAVLGINSMNVEAFPYNSPGHFVNVSGLDIFDLSIDETRITDPNPAALGNIWYDSRDLYQANVNHWRQAIIW